LKSATYKVALLPHIKHKTTGCGPADSSQANAAAARGLTIKSCKLPETHVASCTGRLEHSRAFVLVSTYLLGRLAGFLAHTVTGMLAYSLIRPTRLPLIPYTHFGCGSPGWLLASFLPEEQNPPAARLKPREIPERAARE